MFIVVFEFGVVLGVRSCFYCGVVGVNGGCRVCRVVSRAPVLKRM